MVRWLLALSSIWYFFVNPSFPLSEFCQNDKFVENIKCENIECCCDYVLTTHAHAWPLFLRWTSTSMQKFDKNILFAPALLSPWPQECQNMLLERKVNTFAKCQPPKDLRLKGFCIMQVSILILMDKFKKWSNVPGDLKFVKVTRLQSLRQSKLHGKTQNMRHFLIRNKSA